jgi:hypothetical protein
MAILWTVPRPCRASKGKKKEGTKRDIGLESGITLPKGCAAGRDQAACFFLVANELRLGLQKRRKSIVY